MKRSTSFFLSALCAASGALITSTSGHAAEDTLVFVHGVVNSSGIKFSEAYTMPDEDDINSHDRIGVSRHWTPTAAAAGFGLWYHARHNAESGITQLLRSTSPNSIGNVVYTAFGHTIDALAIGDFGSGPELMVGMNAIWGGSVIWRFTTSGSPTWRHVYGYDAQTEIVALAAADFDGDRTDEVAYGFNYRAGGTVTWVGDSRSLGLQTALYLPAPYSLDALTAGDYSGYGYADLVTAIRYTSSGYTGSSVWRHRGGTTQKWPIFGWDTSGFVDSMASGDFLGTGAPHDELIVGFVNYVRPANIKYSADGWNLTSHPIVNNLPSSYCYAGSRPCHINSRLLVAPFGH